MILAFILGFVTGWGISMPIGPVNAAAIMRTLRFGLWHGFAVGSGAALMDVIYCAGATQINAYLLDSPVINLIFQSIGMLLLVYLGIKALRSGTTHRNMVTQEESKTEAQAEERVEKLHIDRGSVVGSFVLGVVLYASNIASLPEWIFITGFWRDRGLLDDSIQSAICFALGAGVGTAGWFFTLSRYFSKRKTTLQPKTLVVINKIAGIAMLAFGLYFIYQIAFNTNWQEVNKRIDKSVIQSFIG